ncbi:unnamed protein product [Macrosiphum euphorbiae]|uniref:THAP domain-containing protein 9 n=1 Tax=Macrosiphum euphorbiae TaxID=13131 RepID=A0AAV0XQT3_9HEMI|nr:unnamed protein product [Macrosiphum euphorbiae]
MKTIITKLQNENLINEDVGFTLLESFGNKQDLIINWAKKNMGKKVPKKYIPSVRQFALSLHFFSVRSYEYVRQQFNTILPHQRTLSKWYANVNANPGFTQESLKSITLKVKNSTNPVYCALMMDEMAIRQHLQYDSCTGTYYGRVDLGNGMTNDSLDIAKECFVLMVVSVTENWKLPIGYFLVSNLNSSQKSELIKHALTLLQPTGITIISLTFDGCATNLTTAKLLGCDFNINTYSTSFVFDNNEIVTFVDPAHMIKLVRNAFREKKQFMDEEDNMIDFEYILKLFYLQEKEGCHLANKLRKEHIFFCKQKIKVKLASQLLSQSVADALRFCMDNLKMDEFSEAGATIKFIEMFNIAFDILNSRSIHCIGYKKALCRENVNVISIFKDKFTNYIKGLKVKEIDGFVPVLDSKRKTGFIGFIGGLHSVLKLYDNLVDSGKLEHLKLYNSSQDNIELFFITVRASGGHNNNPTAQQFRAVYRKLVIRVNDVQSFNTCNCIPLEDIDILHYSSTDPIKVLNNNSIGISSGTVIDEVNVQNINSLIMDHDYIGNNSEHSSSQFAKEIIIYIAGFVVYKLTNSLKCEECKLGLVAVEKDCFLNSLITLKNRGGEKGGLMYPSEDVISICFKTEHFLKSYNYKQKAINRLEIQSKVLAHYLFSSTIFKSLITYSQETRSPLSDHCTLLIKSIATTYINLKINYIVKKHNETPSLRQWYNKLTLF